MSGIGERLRAARERKNLKQTQVKERTGINNKTLSGYENGVSEPDFDSLKILAECYDVSLDYILMAKPLKPAEYLQRSGRVGRLSPSGLDISDVLDQEEDIYFDGEKLTKDQIETLKKFIRSVILG